MALGNERIWTAVGDRVRCRVDIHADLTATAAEYLTHRLRALRARPHGFHHPVDITLHGNWLEAQFEPGALASGGATDLLTLVSALTDCHAQRVAGFAPIGVMGGRWVAPVSWFLPFRPDVDIGAHVLADRTLLADWADQGVVDKRDRPLIDALRAGDPGRLKRLVHEERQHRATRAEESPAAPSLLTLLTEGELMERVGGLYRYRLLSPREVVGLGLRARDQWVLEVDRNWEDPHFTGLTRPSPQEVWDALIEESKVTPTLAVSANLPDPLRRQRQGMAFDWIGVHEDQPLMYVRTAEEEPDATGFVRLRLAGDDELMDRKREFTSFAGTHPAVTRLLSTPPVAIPFSDNLHSRKELEDAVLATRGVFAVQGPPGTGKTHLATEVIRRFLARTRGARVLVCAKEHFALDHILAKIAGALTSDGVPFRAWRSVSLAKRRRGGHVDATWQGPNVVRELSSRGWTPEAKGWAEWEARAADQHDQRLSTLGQQAANVFFATTMDAAMVDFLGNESFDLVIVEEAGKCYPSELLHAICLGRTALMIGDQRQLPPYQERRTRDGVQAWRHALGRAKREPNFRDAIDARFGPLFRSLEAFASSRGPLSDAELAWLRPFEFLFDRLAARHRLEEQFRMEAPLSRVVGSVFYGRPFDHRKHELIAAGRLPACPLGDVLPPDLDVPLVWLDTPHMTERPEATEDDHKRGVRDNAYEVSVIVRYLRRLQPGSPIDMVILTPYNAQKRLLLDSTELRAVCGRLTPVPFEQVVRTTDEYQGREAELTVLSLVRNNSLGSRAWGFMTEPERLNVMFSRTRFRQVVVGCSAHIERHAAECEWLHRVWQAYRAEGRDPACALIIPADQVLNG